MNYEKIINKKIQDIPPSGIRKYFDIVSEMKDAISLGIGEPDFVTPWHICEAAICAVEEGQTHYSSNWGTIELRREIARYMKHRFALEYDPKDEILVTVGASEGIDLALRTLLEPGDEVLIPEPSYVSYMPGVTFAGGVPVGVVTGEADAFKLTADAVLDKITPRTKALILPYPNNPTGAIMERSYLEALADVLEKTDIMVISDEIYAELSYGGTHESIARLPGMRERTIVLNGFSKAFAMTGWRMGYVCCPRQIMQCMVKIHQYTILCAPMMGQKAAEEALAIGYENDYADISYMRRIYDRRRRMMVQGFRDMGLDCFEPKGAFYVFPNIQKTGFSSEEFCDRLLEEQHVACVPGTAFGPSGEGFVRCSYAAATDQLKIALERIACFVKKYIKAG
nr:aminotransferase class I/II-fold pyridoxal phosphate-dependent enzyme [Maliibacterium massiliense]